MICKGKWFGKLAATCTAAAVAAAVAAAAASAASAAVELDVRFFNPSSNYIGKNRFRRRVQTFVF